MEVGRRGENQGGEGIGAFSSVVRRVLGVWPACLKLAQPAKDSRVSHSATDPAHPMLPANQFNGQNYLLSQQSGAHFLEKHNFLIKSSTLNKLRTHASAENDLNEICMPKLKDPVSRFVKGGMIYDNKHN